MSLDPQVRRYLDMAWPLLPLHSKDFPSRRALAKYLAETTGRSWSICEKWLRRFDNDANRVIAHAAKVPPHARIAITVAGRAFSSHIGGAVLCHAPQLSIMR